ncbi:MAG: PqiC family protein [Gemmatimonadota bacterium]
MHILLPSLRPEHSRLGRRRSDRQPDRLLAGFAASALVPAILLLSGCFSLSRDAPPQQHYVLGAGATDAPELVVGTDETALPTLVGLRPPLIADYLATPYLVVRHGSHRVEFSEFHRWGEDLGRGINRTVALLLTQAAPELRGVAAPWSTGAMPAYLVQLQVLRFEGAVPEEAVATGADPPPGSGSSHLEVAWEIIQPRDGATVARGSTEVIEPGWTVGDHAALVQRLDSALGILAGELAEAFDRVLAPTE